MSTQFRPATVIHRIPAPVSAASVVAAVLAGGRGERMGGADKGLLPFQGRALVDHVLDRVRPQAGSVVISANRNQERYLMRGLPVVADGTEGHQGPLAGMVAIMDAVKAPWYLFVPCDTPALPADLLQRLIDVQRRTGRAVVCASDAMGLHPTLALVSASLHAPLKHALSLGERRLQKVFALLGLAIAEWADPLPFSNVNTPEQCEAVGGGAPGVLHG